MEYLIAKIIAKTTATLIANIIATLIANLIAKLIANPTHKKIFLTLIVLKIWKVFVLNLRQFCLKL